ncbi:hypothetical protein FB381_2407 [Nocardioides albertanoniae]|uniref:Uncharacterized protein n=1 Tax=Nocardioides albertanoniae TaxID=1175486 RepID=A0A543A7F4_9ACTN|nr:hypothetical protein [Nocardioides albertanoniae]TQL68517.1 hypothetical protein FB381_2407 [Nocardioides albertanoniae]
MFNRNFYAAQDDRRFVVGYALDLGFRVFDAFSAPGQPLSEITTTASASLLAARPAFKLYAPNTGPEPVITRVELDEDEFGPSAYEYQCNGWGLIGLNFGGVVGLGGLGWSTLNTMAEARATRWHAVEPIGAAPSEWNWPAVDDAAGKMFEAIVSLANTAVGDSPILAAAGQMIKDKGLLYESGGGLHARPGLG